MLQLFCSALGMGKIMRDPAPHVAHGRKTLHMCGSKIIPAFDLKGFILVLGNIIRPCQLRFMVSKIIPAFDLKVSYAGIRQYYQPMSADLIIDKFH